MKTTKKELEMELKTCVAHIARRCEMFQDEIWEAMHELSKKNLIINKNESFKIL